MDPTLSLIAGIIGLAATFAFRMWLKSSKYEAIFRAGVPIAFNIVNDIAKRTDNQIDDKVALGLSLLNDWLNVNGQPAMKAPDEEKAKLLFKALHGEGK